MPKTEFDYYYGEESEQFSFVRVPRVLFTDKEHFGNLSNEAKLLYGLLLERMSLSRKNNWIDKHNRVYIIFPVEEIEESLDVGHEKALNLLKELDDQSGIGLVRKKRRGLGLPSILYVKNFIVKGEQNTDRVPTSRSTENEFQEVGKTDFKKSENQTSANPKNRLLEVRNSDSNNIDINNTDMSYTYDQSINLPRTDFQNFSPGDGLIDGIDRNTVEEEIKKQIDYDCLISHPDSSVVQMAEEIKDLMVDVLCGERSVVSEGKRVSEETAKSAYGKITFEHVQYVLQSLVNYPEKISRIDRFLTTSLFNSVYTLTNATFAGFEHDMGLKMI
jgi:replication initiator protein A (repA) N-terminus|nr:MAG TPA: replication initiator protein [Caudoviricetes sp.]